MKKIFIITLIALSLWSVSGSVTMAASWTNGLVTCGKGAGTPDKPAATSCDFSALIDMVNTIIQYLIFIAMPLAAISFAYAGWIYLSAGGDTGKVKKAHEIFANVGIGLILVLSAWLIFKLIATKFLSDTYSSSTYLK